MKRLSPDAVARKRLEADFAADDITVEEYAREESRLDAGSARSTYLVAARREVARRRLVRWAVVGAVALVLLFAALVVSLTGRTGQAVEPPSNPSVAPSPAPTQVAPAQPQAQPQQEFDDDDDFEEDDD